MTKWSDKNHFRGMENPRMLTLIVTNLQSDNPGTCGSPVASALTWLTWFHWRVRLFSQDSAPAAPPTPARWARDSAWRPGWTLRATSSRSSCAWPGLRCRPTRIWADPHSPRTVLPVQQSHSGQCLPLMRRVTTCGNCLVFPQTDSVYSN